MFLLETWPAELIIAPLTCAAILRVWESSGLMIALLERSRRFISIRSRSGGKIWAPLGQSNTRASLILSAPDLICSGQGD